MLILEAIDEKVVAQFKNAWRAGGAVVDKIEALVLLGSSLKMEFQFQPCFEQFELMTNGLTPGDFLHVR